MAGRGGALLYGDQICVDIGLQTKSVPVLGGRNKVIFVVLTPET
jgi:hypothetical protein